MDISIKQPKIIWHILLGVMYLLMLYNLHTYKYQTPSLILQGIYSANGKSTWVIGIYSICCTTLILGIIYVQTQSKLFTLFASMLFGLLYVLLVVLFFIEKIVSKTLLPDKLNSQVEILVCYPFLLVFLLACSKMYAIHESQNQNR
jgi:hypothetical protein